MEKINIGTTPNDFTGDTLRAAMQKINANIEEIIAPILTVKADVAAFADLATTYPNPEFGWAARVTEDGFIYSWNGFAWKNTGQKNGTVVQTTGTSTTDVMSQKAVTDEIAQLAGDVSIKIRNLITNGDFVNDINGWSWSDSIMSVEYDSGRLKIYGWTTSSHRVISPAMDGLSIGDLLYLRIGEYERSAMPWANRIGIRINDTNPYIIEELNNPNLIIQNLSGIAAYNGGIPKLHIRTYQDVANSVWIDDVVCINLTETFGAGNEPTKEEMDLLISTLGMDYFEGEITIPAQKIMQWQQVKSLNAMFMRAGFQIKDVTSYNDYGIPNEYNCVWEDGIEGHVVLSNFDENVFEYKRKKAYYKDIEVDYGDVIYDENGYILSKSQTLIN